MQIGDVYNTDTSDIFTIDRKWNIPSICREGSPVPWSRRPGSHYQHGLAKLERFARHV